MSLVAGSKNIEETRFREQLVGLMKSFLRYENPRNREVALKSIPVGDLTQIAEAKQISCADADGSSLNMTRDFLLLELLRWFKEDFFTWMDKPTCPRCSKTMDMVPSANNQPTPEEFLKSASRVEVYSCNNCSEEGVAQFVRFPRYNNPIVLLQTRTGRCGEWANCFALICRAMGFEVRHVTDWADHVWVEVFSSAQNRWLHCDPCENKCDTPLLYESGWGKKISYIIAVSHDDIQDVTWRYSHSNNHKEVRSRRRLVREDWLLKTLLELRESRQKLCSADRQQVLQKRLIAELVEFMGSTKDEVQVNGLGGRESGSLAWRLARQEIRADDEALTNVQASFTWQISDQILEKYGEGDILEFFYDAVSNEYYIGREHRDAKHLTGWQSGLFNADNMARKEEKDWKMVYLARKENNGSQLGTVAWKFAVTDTQLKMYSVRLRIPSTIFHPSASISFAVQTSTGMTRAIPDSAFDNEFCNFTFRLKPEVRWFTIICTLGGGTGEIAWQQAQLFRESMTRIDSSFVEPFLTLTMSKSAN